MAEPWQLKAVLSANSKGLTDSLSHVQKVAKNTRKYLLDIGKAAGHLGGRVGLPTAAIAGILGGLSIGGIKGALTGFAAMGDAVHKGALQAGMSVEEYQRMKYAAEQAGTSAEGLVNAMGKLNLNTGNAAHGKNASLAELYKKLGINMRGANGQVRSGIDLLPELADAFKRNTSKTNQSMMGTALFGKQWKELLPLLMEGAEGINKSTSRFDRLKGALSEADVQQAKELGDSFKDLDVAFSGVKETVARELTPVVIPLIKQFEQWWVVNKKLVSVEVGKMAMDLGKWIKTIDFEKIVKDVRALCGGFAWLIETVGGATNAIILLVAWMNRAAIVAAWNLGASVFRAGMYLYSVFIPATVAATAATTGLAAATTAADTAALGLGTRLKAIVAFAGQAALAVAPLAAMWGVKEWAQDTSHDQERVSTLRGWSDSLASVLPDWMGDPSKGAREQYLSNRTDLIGSDRGNVSGEITLRFENAPAGLRVDQGSQKGPVAINADVGYRSFAMGMP
jgi:hypothetical protein